MRVINIRGANGAGKTTLVRALIAHDGEQVPVKVGVTDTPGHWLPRLGVLVIGPYVDGKATGGMDNVRTTLEALNAVTEGAVGTFRGQGAPDYGDPPTAIVFEGVLISTVYATWLEMSRRLAREHGRGMTWAFLATPLEQCIERVRARRAAKGRPEEGFNEQLIRDKVKSITAIRGKALGAAEDVVDLMPGRELDQLLGVIGG